MPPQQESPTEKLETAFPHPTKLQEFLYSLLDFLYPRRCIGCGQEGLWFCADCQGKIVKIATPTCFFCQTITEGGKTCPRCRGKVALTGVIVYGYHEAVLKDAIHALKYDYISELANPLGSLLAIAIFDRRISGYPVLVPIPLHRSRLAQRGFNQSELLARSIGKRLRREVDTSLVRVKNPVPQTELSGQARRKNMAGAFAWRGGSLKGKTVLLIDDVATTGTTLDEAARILRQAGARQVWGGVVAKG